MPSWVRLMGATLTGPIGDASVRSASTQPLPERTGTLWEAVGVPVGLCASGQTSCGVAPQAPSALFGSPVLPSPTPPPPEPPGASPPPASIAGTAPPAAGDGGNCRVARPAAEVAPLCDPSKDGVDLASTVA